MRTIALVFLLNVLFFGSYGQNFTFIDGTNFESNAELVTIDQWNISNRWQVGIPSKSFFNEAYSIPGAIVTDLINPYNANSKSRFHITIKDEAWFFGSPSYLGFYHKYDTDTLLDGGYIDVSYDGGMTWLNIIHDSTMYNCDWTPGFGYYGENFYSDSDTLFNGEYGFSGRSDGWEFSSFEWYYCIGVRSDLPDSLMIRFNFISDLEQTNKEGWMIDDITLHSLECSAVNENHTKLVSAVVNPNPVSSVINIYLSGYRQQTFTLRLFNLSGKEVYRQQYDSQPISVDVSSLSQGIYTYLIQSEGFYPVNGRFIKK